MPQDKSHLKQYQFKPGQSGNPAGRKPRMSFEGWVAEILDEHLPGSNATKREALARVFVNMMLNKSGHMIREYLAREWPQVQKHEVEFYGESENELEAAIDRFRPGAESGIPPRLNGNGKA